jgi:putative MFS transporter
MVGFGACLKGRQASSVFVLGCAAVTAGVGLHLPMFLMARDMAYQLAGMSMDDGMVAGMALIIAGVLAAAYGLIPPRLVAHRAALGAIEVAAPEDLPLSAAHWLLMLALVIALVIDIMKPASLGFTIAGMMAEYGISKTTASLVPFSALIGTVAGSVLWGVLADVFGRKASILLSAVMFVGTSICGAMPSLAWNVAMCFLMGAAAGGMLPVAYALLAEMIPSRHRGWSLVLVGGLGAAGGYFAASGISAVLQPTFGWRILWLSNLPTGLMLVLLGGFIPESARFLIARGRRAEAEAVMRRFGGLVARSAVREPALDAVADRVTGARLAAKLAALSIAGIAWGLVNFGLLLWLPADLVANGYSVEVSSKLLAKSALIAFPTIFVTALLYGSWSTKWSLVAMIGSMICGLAGVISLAASNGGNPVLPVALLIVGSNGVIAILLPYAAESFPLRVRARATGWVAACTKVGGVLAQGLSIVTVVPSTGVAAVLIALPAAAALGMIALFGQETRGRDLRDLDPVPT